MLLAINVHRPLTTNAAGGQHIPDMSHTVQNSPTNNSSVWRISEKLKQKSISLK